MMNPIATVQLRQTKTSLSWVVLDCPYCHGTHTHGAGPLAVNAPDGFLGHRLTHCGNPGDGYTLVKESPRHYFHGDLHPEGGWYCAACDSFHLDLVTFRWTDMLRLRESYERGSYFGDFRRPKDSANLIHVGPPTGRICPPGVVRRKVRDRPCPLEIKCVPRGPLRTSDLEVRSRFTQ